MRPRHVPLTSTVRTILSRRARSLDTNALVFPNSEGHRDLRWAKKTVPAALRAAQIDDFRFHDLPTHLRQPFGDGGRRPHDHPDKTMAMTLRYSHLSPGHRRIAIERLVTRATTADPEASVVAE